MTFHEMALQGVYRVELEKREDHRGFFARVWCAEEYRKHGLCAEYVQHNVGFSPRRGTLRGIHYQRAPHCEVKVVRCTMGKVFDVAVDLRTDSESYGKWCGIELSATNRSMLYIPEGCAHGYLTLADDAEVIYYTSKSYAPESSSGVRYDDPELGIVWPEPVRVVSDADCTWPLLTR